MSASPAQPTRTGEYFRHRQVRSGVAGSAAMSPSDDPLPEVVRTVAGADSPRAAVVNHTGPAGPAASFSSILFALSRRLFTLSRTGYPSHFLSLTGRRRIPWVALIVPGVTVSCVHFADVEPAAVTDQEPGRGAERL